MAAPSFDQFGAMALDQISSEHSECANLMILSPASRAKTAGRVRFSKSVSRRVEEFVGAGLEAKIDIADLAANFGYSCSHFFRLFRRTFGVTPHAYVMRRRLVLAQNLLAATDLGLAEVALRSGFCDQSHLCRSFRQFSGIPPGAFRARLRAFT
jgi:AraC family transcriptional regulator